MTDSWPEKVSQSGPGYIGEKSRGLDFTHGDVTAFKSVALCRDVRNTATSVIVVVIIFIFG